MSRSKLWQVIAHGKYKLTVRSMVRMVSKDLQHVKCRYGAPLRWYHERKFPKNLKICVWVLKTPPPAPPPAVLSLKPLSQATFRPLIPRNPALHLHYTTLILPQTHTPSHSPPTYTRKTPIPTAPQPYNTPKLPMPSALSTTTQKPLHLPHRPNTSPNYNTAPLPTPNPATIRIWVIC